MEAKQESTIGKLLLPKDKSGMPFEITHPESRSLLVMGNQNAGKSTFAKKYVGSLFRTCKDHVPTVVVLESMNMEDISPRWSDITNYVNEDFCRGIPLLCPAMPLYADNEEKISPREINVWKVPDGFSPNQWISLTVDMFCTTYALSGRCKDALTDIVTGLYRKAGVWNAENDEMARKASASVSFDSIIARTEECVSAKEKRANKACYPELLACLCESKNPMFSDILATCRGVSLSETVYDGVNIFHGSHKGHRVHEFLYNCIVMYFTKQQKKDVVLVIEEDNCFNKSLLERAILHKSDNSHIVLNTFFTFMAAASVECLNKFDYIISKWLSSDCKEKMYSFSGLSESELTEYGVYDYLFRTFSPIGVFTKITSKANAEETPEMFTTITSRSTFERLVGIRRPNQGDSE